MSLRLDNIQSEILRGYQRSTADPSPRSAIYLLIHFSSPSPSTARAFVRRLLPLVTSARDWTREHSVNLAFSYRGLEEALDEGEELRRGAPEFAEGMASRAQTLLSDEGEAAPARWQFSDGDQGEFRPVHMLVMIQGSETPATERTLAEILALLDPVEATWRIERACRLKDNREHFGFVDGLSQPALEGIDGPIEGHGAIDQDGRWRAIKAGEIVLGYPDEAGPFAGSSFLADGSFIAVRKLEQDVWGFRKFIEEEAQYLGEIPGSEQDRPKWLASRMVGRTPDGDPLVPGVKRSGQNAFRYSSDPLGLHCPHGAHIRRANPRDALNRFGDRAERHRIVRRGLMYGYDSEDHFVLEPDSEAAIWRSVSREGDGVRRGMIFIAFNASLERQFEFVQRNWLNSGETARNQLFTCPDPLTGANDGDSHFVIPGHPFKVVGALPRFVTTRAGGYFFVPGMTTLERLAAPRRNDRARAAGGMTAPAKPRAPNTSITSNWLGATADLLGAVRLWASNSQDLARTRPLTPEDRLLLVMAPIRDGERANIEHELRDKQRREDLDELFAAVREGTAPLVHHARFVIVDNFWEWPESLRREGRERVELPHRAGYILFMVWFDGGRDQFIRALARAIRSRRFLLDHCHGFPSDRMMDPEHRQHLRLRAFFARFGLRTAFAHEGYSGSTDQVTKALAIRGRFLNFVRELQREPSKATEIHRFFSENEDLLAD